MHRFVKSTLSRIAFTTVALAAITGSHARSADTELRPALEGMRDEIRELRRDVKALRELLERREDRATDALPDLPGVHIESYLESNISLRAQGSVKKMTGNEIIASIDGRPVFASEIFQRAFTKALTPEGTTLLTATQSLASGHISEQDFRELQVFAIRKFAKYYIRTRVLSQAMIASLGKTQKAKTEDAIAKEFDNYVEKLKKDLKVTTVFDVDKKLREQGTSLLSLKDEFRDRLLADEYLRGVAKRIEDPPAKASPAKRGPARAVAPRWDRAVTVACDDQPLSEVLDLILPPSELRENLKLGEGAFQKTTAVGRDKLVDVSDLDGLLKQHVTLRVSDVTASRALHIALKQLHLSYEVKDGVVTLVPDAEGAVSNALSLDRRVTVDCDDRPLSEVLDRIVGDRRRIEFRYEQPFGAFHYSTVQHMDGGPGPESLAAAFSQRVTLHVAEVTLSAALERVFDQLHVRYEVQEGHLRIDFPADEKRREALKRRMTIDCDKLPLQKFIEHITRDWQLAKVVLVPTTIDLQSPITMHVSDATLESILKQGFDQAHVRFEFRDEVLLLSPADPLVLLTYQVADLVTTPGSVPPDKVDFKPLETAIQIATDPKSWKGAGGEGQIDHMENTLSLIVRQTPQIHQQIASLLRELRKPQQLRITVRAAVLDQRAGELFESSGGPESGKSFVRLTKAQCDLLFRVYGRSSVLEQLPAASVMLGKEATIITKQQSHVWPDKVRLRTGQIAGRSYVWFDLSGSDPLYAGFLPETVVSVLPDLKPLLIEMKIPPAPSKFREWPWGPSRTVDELLKVPERRFLLIQPEAEVTPPPKEGQESRP
ncbi:MAG TPA: STN domain-containing protein [Planctomycetaceae bacterium]|nr:STN domain-containing protein [Planctomycetaceae bacterium]